MLLDTLLAFLQGWAPAFAQQRTCQRAIALALGLYFPRKNGHAILGFLGCFWGRA
jgi:hypothetical protein